MVEQVLNSDIEKIAKIELNEDDKDKIVQEKNEEIADDKELKDIKESKANYKEELFAPQTWEELGVKDEIKKGLLEMNFLKPSKIQAVAFSLVTTQKDKHLIAQSQNGSGKTGGFGIPLISCIDENSSDVQAVVFSHNREMVSQNKTVLSNIAKYTKIKVEEILKDREVKKGQVIVCTPGTFEKVFISRKEYPLKNLKMLVLDEADYMLNTDSTASIFQNLFDMLKKSNTSPRILFFSATFSPENYKFIGQYYKGKTLSIKVEKGDLTLKNVRQMYIRCDNKGSKESVIEEYLKANIDAERVIIFANSKNNVLDLADRLKAKNYKVFVLMGGDMDPANRDETVRRFNLGQIQILITTDLLSRGFDEKLVKLVINYDIPLTKDFSTGRLVPAMDTYLHRIGRTGRFGTKGIGLSLVESKFISNIEAIQKTYSSTIEEITTMDTLINEFKKLLNEY